MKRKIILIILITILFSSIFIYISALSFSALTISSYGTDTCTYSSNNINNSWTQICKIDFDKNEYIIRVQIGIKIVFDYPVKLEFYNNKYISNNIDNNTKPIIEIEGRNISFNKNFYPIDWNNSPYYLLFKIDPYVKILNITSIIIIIGNISYYKHSSISFFFVNQYTTIFFQWTLNNAKITLLYAWLFLFITKEKAL